MKHTKILSLLISVVVLAGCNNNNGCKMCGCDDSYIESELVEHDVFLPYRLDKGLEVIVNGKDTVTLYSDSLILRKTQMQYRRMEICSNCGHIIRKDYETQFHDYGDNAEYSTVHTYIEHIGSGEMVVDFGYELGAIIIH